MRRKYMIYIDNNMLIPSYIPINQGSNTDLRSSLSIKRIDNTTFTLIIKDYWYLNQNKDVKNLLDDSGIYTIYVYISYVCIK